MKVLLAGYNVDAAVLEELKLSSPPRNDITPETLSAAYARISRDPRSIDVLRADARNEVERARKSNQSIIFKMGHHSVAEHAVFNFDIIGVSRLAIEELEKFRLCSFTEKSQRYNKLEDDFIIPREVEAVGKAGLFTAVAHQQNSCYHRLYEKILPFMFASHPDLAADKRRHSILEGWAKEDARYIVSLATEGQLGLTANARNLEFMIRRFASKRLAELGDLNQEIYRLAKQAAPSIILFTEANEFDSNVYSDIAAVGREALDIGKGRDHDPVRLVDSTPDADIRLAAALLYSTSAVSYRECRQAVEAMDAEKTAELIRAAFRRMEFYDRVVREFEYIDLTFELVLSSAGFAQLKRHRMATITTQAYDPGLGVTIPPSVEAVGMKPEFLDIIDKTNSAYHELKSILDIGAEYILTNAHRRRILFKLNARELYHFSRLREDVTAQWDIRLISAAMTEQAKAVMPLTLMLIGGKDSYPKIYNRLFGRPPKEFPPPFC